MKYQAEPLKRVQIRALALQIRTAVGLENQLWFPILRFMELVMPIWFLKFNCEIATKDELPPEIHADTDVVHHIIRIRDDVYDGAYAGKGRDRMTVAHEAAHYILLVVCGIKFARSFDAAPVDAYQDPEWQAKALAGELLCSHHLIRRMMPYQIVSACGVSKDAAVYALKH